MGDTYLLPAGRSLHGKKCLGVRELQFANAVSKREACVLHTRPLGRREDRGEGAEEGRAVPGGGSLVGGGVWRWPDLGTEE